jgi:hypothetical protein
MRVVTESGRVFRTCDASAADEIVNARAGFRCSSKKDILEFLGRNLTLGPATWAGALQTCPTGPGLSLNVTGSRFSVSPTKVVILSEKMEFFSVKKLIFPWFDLG